MLLRRDPQPLDIPTPLLPLCVYLFTRDIFIGFNIPRKYRGKVVLLGSSCESAASWLSVYAFYYLVLSIHMT